MHSSMVFGDRKGLFATLQVVGRSLHRCNGYDTVGGFPARIWRISGWDLEDLFAWIISQLHGV